MSELDEIVKAMQVGTNRSVPAENPHHSTGESAARRVLREAGTHDIVQRVASCKLGRVSPIPTAPAEIAEVVKTTETQFRHTLYGRTKGIIVEWAIVAASKGKIAPAWELSTLLYTCKEHPELVPVLGNRGKWLAELEELNIPGLGFDTYRQMRSENPDDYRKWVKREFRSLTDGQRVKAISAFGTDLTLADEPVLTIALVNRNRDVREAAFELLARLPGTEVSEELANIAADILVLENIKGELKMVIRPPDPSRLPKALPRTKITRYEDPAEFLIQDVIGLVPPQKWTSDFGMDEIQILSLLTKTDDFDCIFNALVRAALRYQDQRWIDSLFYVQAIRAVRRGGWDTLCPNVSELLFDQTVATRLSARTPQDWVVVAMLANRKRMFSPWLSRRIADSLSVQDLRRSEEDIFPFLHRSIGNSLGRLGEGDDEYWGRERVAEWFAQREDFLSSLDD